MHTEFEVGWSMCSCPSICILFTECQQGLFGYNCSQRCLTDVCAQSDVCDTQTGQCLSGCLYPGFQAPFCTLGRFGQSN